MRPIGRGASTVAIVTDTERTLAKYWSPNRQGGGFSGAVSAVVGDTRSRGRGRGPFELMVSARIRMWILITPGGRAAALAWDSFLAGTTPVGAVVVDAAGVVVTEGRGRRYDAPTSGPQLSYCHVAHAELNAVALLPQDRHYEDRTLVTTLEPCCMCLGAALQATITTPR